MPGTEKTIEVNGKAITLVNGGGGTPLLYLHGAGAYWWMPVHDLLAATWSGSRSAAGSPRSSRCVTRRA